MSGGEFVTRRIGRVDLEIVAEQLAGFFFDRRPVRPRGPNRGQGKERAQRGSEEENSFRKRLHRLAALSGNRPDYPAGGRKGEPLISLVLQRAVRVPPGRAHTVCRRTRT